MPGICSRCDREVYFAEERLALGKVWHALCFACRNCRKLLDSSSVSTHCGELFCKNCYVRLCSPNARTLPDGVLRSDIKRIRTLLPSASLAIEDLSHFSCKLIGKPRLRGGGSNDGLSAAFEGEKKHFGLNDCTDIHADKHRATPSGCEERAIRHPILTCGSNKAATIPSRRRFAYPPIPLPRSPPPSRRRVSFCDVVFGDRCRNDRPSEMQHNHRCNNDDVSTEEYCTSYDIWRADEAAGRSECGYENINNSNEIEDAGRAHFGKTASDCCDIADLRNCEETEKNYEDRTSESLTDSHANRASEDANEDAQLSKNLPSHGRKTEFPNEFDNERMRGGCGEIRVDDHSCCSRGNDRDFNNNRPGSCASQGRNTQGNSPQEPTPCCNNVTTCASCPPPLDRRGCCPSTSDRPLCRKAIVRCRPPCKGESQSCGAGGCCGSGCRGGCGKPGQTCMPSRPCATPPCRLYSSIRPCTPQPSCCRSGQRSSVGGAEGADPYTTGECGSCCGGSCRRPGKAVNYCEIGSGSNCCRSGSPRSTATGSRGCCISGGARGIDGAMGSCCRRKHFGCECLGGGLDCQRCGRKVYQAEMQIASGVPYHNICFSCFCCRKPLEPLTYQENCGEIYCKQCYVRNFGPQGYGYGVGAGALQTPM